MALFWKKGANFQNEWAGIEAVVSKLLRQEPVTHDEWQDIFSAVRNVSWNQHVEELKTNLTCEIEQFVLSVCQSILRENGSVEILRKYVVEWARFVRQAEILPCPFAKLENQSELAPSGLGNVYSQDPNIPVAQKHLAAAILTTNALAGGAISGTNGLVDGSTFVQNTMYDLWYRHVFDSLQATLLESAMRSVEEERSAASADSSKSTFILPVKESFLRLNGRKLYHLYEKRYVDAVEEHYGSLAHSYMSENGTYAYMKWAVDTINREEAMAGKDRRDGSGYIDKDSLPILKQRLDKVLIIDVLSALQAEIRMAMQNREIEKLSLLYTLGSRVPLGCGPILQELDRHIFESGLAEMRSNAEAMQKDCEKYVEKLLELMNSFTSLVSAAFANDRAFQTAADQAFSRLVNDTSVFRIELPIRVGGPKLNAESRCPEQLANYCDMLMRKTPLSRSIDVERRLYEVVRILRFVENKDVFMRFHKAHLTRRLLLELSADDDKEELLTQLLRQEGMPPETLNQIQVMFQDIKLSRTMRDTFLEFCQSYYPNSPVLRDQVTLKVLKQSAWQRTSGATAGAGGRIPLALPSEIEDLFMPVIERFYQSRHQGRKLFFNHNLSSCQITFATTTGGSFELETTTPQAVVLFAFNDKSTARLSLEDLRLATGMENGPELNRVLLSLIMSTKMVKIPILMCDLEPLPTKPDDFQQSTKFWINQDFAIVGKQNKLQKRGRITLIGRLPIGVDTSRIDGDEADGIVQLRVYRVQEGIMRLMKERRRLGLTAIENEVTTMLRHSFVPTKRLVKEQLEWLMDNKYVKRDDDDMTTYLYVA